MFATWGVDEATEEELGALVEAVRRFLDNVRPRRLFISGRRTVAVAERAETLLGHVLAQV